MMPDSFDARGEICSTCECTVEWCECENEEDDESDLLDGDDDESEDDD